MLKVVKPFDFYHDGIHRTHYGEGPQDLPEDAAKVALAEGWAVENHLIASTNNQPLQRERKRK